MIRQIGTWKLRWKIFAMVAVLCLGAATLTDAKEKKPKKSAADIQKKIDKLQTQLQKAKDAEHGAIYKPEKMPSQDDERFPKNFPSLKFIGDYSGMEGDRPIDFSLNIRAITADDPIFSRSTGKKFEVDRIEYTISKELFATVYRGGFSKDKKIQDDVYLGRLRYVNSNELELCVVKHFKDNADQKSIPDALKKLSVKVIRDGDKVVTLEIPKNDVWGEIHVTRTVREAKTLPSAPLQKAKDAEVEVGMISVQVSPDGKRQPYPLKQIVGKYSGKYKDSDLEMLVFDKNIAGYEVMIRMDDYIRGSGMAVLVDESGTPIVAGKPAHGLKVEYSTQENRSSVVRFNVTFKKENDDLTAEMKIENTGEIVALRKIVFEIPDWFLKRDKNGDGNLTLSEYADGKPVTESMIREFEGLDADRDGVVTTAEVQKFLDLVEKYKQEQKSVPLQEPTVKPDVVKDKLDPKTEKKMPQPGELRAVEMKIDPTPLADSDVLVFDGQWKNEKTGADIAAGTVFKGSKGMFRLTVENGLGKVLLLDGSGATGEGKYVRLSDGGQAIGTSMLPRKEILEAQAEEYARLLKNTAIVQAYAMTDLTHTDGIIAELQKRLADSPDVRISKDVKTNMLLVVGDKTDHEKVKEFLAEVRKEQAEIRKSMKDEASESAAVRVAAGAFPGQYLGTEGKHRIGIEIGDGNTRPITIYENGLPGNGYDILKDKKYVGTLQLNANLISGKMWSPITLKQKFVGSREEPLEPELRELKMAIELKAENNDIVLVLSIPKNKIWDEVRVTKTLKEKSSPQHGELRSVETKIDPTPLADSDVLVFDGQWKNEKTGADIAAGTVFKGSKGMFRLTVENGLGKVLRLDGFGASGEGKYICLSNGGQAIETSILSRKVLSAVKAEVEELATKSLAGRYLGREGDDKMGMVLAPSTKTVGDYDVTVYEDGLPDDGHDPNDDDRYEGTATFKDGMLEIRLAKKFDEGREEPVEKPLQHLTATIGIDTEGNVKIDIPRNAEWDAVRLEKRK